MDKVSAQLEISTPRGEEMISTEFTDDAHCDTILIFAHGAGAGMNHQFMNSVTDALVKAGIATFRFQFPYMEQGRRAPDRQNILTGCIEQVADFVHKKYGTRPLYVGGKSMGGRMASIAAADGKLGGCRGLIFFGFPLHAAGKPSQKRAAHLTDVNERLLFLQGTRDRLADVEEISSVCRVLGDRATLEIFDGADHSFVYLKSAQRSPESVYVELVARVRAWIDNNPQPNGRE